MQRPYEIVWFERIILGTLALGLLNSWLAWPQLFPMRGPAFLLTTQLLTLAIMLGLTFFIPRRRSNIAKWIMVGLFVVGLPIVFQQAFFGQLHGALLITLAQLIGQIVAYAMLFVPSSRRWFRKTKPTPA